MNAIINLIAKCQTLAALQAKARFEGPRARQYFDSAASAFPFAEVAEVLEESTAWSCVKFEQRRLRELMDLLCPEGSSNDDERFDACKEVIAERDSLRAELSDMTYERDILLHKAEELRAELDAAGKRIYELMAERDNAKAENERLERDRCKDCARVEGAHP